MDLCLLDEWKKQMMFLQDYQKMSLYLQHDAVRNAGDGDVDKGAEVMYNMMKNLEAGGDVSEESQGLEGARRMFQTSQRLEEVL